MISRSYSLDYLLSISSQVPDSVHGNICQSLYDHDCLELISSYSPFYPKMEPGFFFVKKPACSFNEPESFDTTALELDLAVMRYRGEMVCSPLLFEKKIKKPCLPLSVVWPEAKRGFRRKNSRVRP